MTAKPVELIMYNYFNIIPTELPDLSDEINPKNIDNGSYYMLKISINNSLPYLNYQDQYLIIIFFTKIVLNRN